MNNLCAKSNTDNENIMVAIHCMVYNHGEYLKDALDGFINQKTNFRYVAIVHDDASTDNSKEIIESYSRKFPDKIIALYESENQYSKKDGSIHRIMANAIMETNAKYVAICEGDDYWQDPLKLQKQVDFLQCNSAYSMCTTNFNNQYGNIIKESSSNVKELTTYSMREIILNGGAFIATASLLIRSEMFLSIPVKMHTLYVADYPWQIYMGHLGKVGRLKDNTCTHRVAANGSWTQNNLRFLKSLPYIDRKVASEFYLLETMDMLTNFEYSNLFKIRNILYDFHSYIHLSPIYSFKKFLKHPHIILKFASCKVILYSLLPQKLKDLYRNKFRKF